MKPKESPSTSPAASAIGAAGPADPLKGPCPDCGSADVRSALSLYKTAKSYSRSSLSRVAMTGGAGFYLDGVNVRATPETLMSAKFAPPKKPRFSWWLSSVTVSCAILIYFSLTEFAGISVWLALAVSAGCVAADHLIRQLILRSKLALYRKEHAEWEKIWVCMDCENSFAAD